MRTVLGIISFFTGAMTGVVFVLVNPIGLSDGIKPFGSESLLVTRFDSTGYRGMDISPLSLMGIGNPGSRHGLQDSANRYARVSTVVLESDDGEPAAFAVKLSALGKQNNLLSGRLDMTTNWNLFWPGQGSIFLAGTENYWTLVSDGTVSGLKGEGFQIKPETYGLSARHHSGTVPRVIGASGLYKDTEGRFRESADPVSRSMAQLSGFLEIQETPDQSD